MSRFLATLARKRVLVLDGALATEFERRGVDLDHPLWSARCLTETPETLTAVHRAYLDAGADVITSSGYQASVRGFEAQGHDRARAEELVRSAIVLAHRAVEEYAVAHDERPLVAASVGPYGAYLADGSEYRGDYDATDDELRAFHRQQLELVAAEHAAGHLDVVACETIPSLREARVLAGLVTDLALPAWIAFSCRDERTTCGGQDVVEAAEALAEFDGVVALGLNCTAPRHAAELLRRFASATDRPLVCYPNSGEVYDVGRRGWDQEPQGASNTADWFDAGAAVLGGCCRTGPADVAAIRAWRDARD